MAESALADNPLVMMNELPDLCKDGKQAIVAFTEHIECIIIGSNYRSSGLYHKMLHSRLMAEIRITAHQGELRIHELH